MSPRRPPHPTTTVLAATLALTLLLAGCAHGPSQTERIADARATWEVVTAFARDADQRIQDLLIAIHPERTFTSSGMEPDQGGWSACGAEPYNDHWDGPSEVFWAFKVWYYVEPREPTVDLIEPLMRSYLAEGWSLWRDRRDTEPSMVALVKDGYTLHIQGTSQEHLDSVKPTSLPHLWVEVMSPCAPAPDHLTEWDPHDPDDFSFATQAPPDPAG
jgi:hypothetical protein